MFGEALSVEQRLAVQTCFVDLKVWRIEVILSKQAARLVSMNCLTQEIENLS